MILSGKRLACNFHAWFYNLNWHFMTSLYIFFSTYCLILQLSSKASIIILWHVSNFFHLTFWQLTFMTFNDSAWILYRNNFLWCWNATLSVYIDLMKRLLSLDQVFKDLEIFLCLFASSKKYYSIHCNRHWHFYGHWKRKKYQFLQISYK